MKYDKVSDDLLADVQDIMSNGSTIEKLATLEYVAEYFNTDIKMLSILVDASQDKANEAVAKKGKELFINNMEKFIIKFINEQYPTFVGAHYEDLVQVAKMGIIIGLEKYNPLIAKPTTFFILYMKHEVSQYINQFVNNLSTYYANEKYKINRAISQLENENKEPTDINIAEVLDYRVETVKQLKSVIESSTNVQFNDIFLNTEDPLGTPEEQYIKEEVVEDIYKAINKKLSDVEKKVIQLHYALTGAKVVLQRGEVIPSRLAFRDISKELQMPYDKVRHYHTTALRKLHTAFDEDKNK